MADRGRNHRDRSNPPDRRGLQQKFQGTPLNLLGFPPNDQRFPHDMREFPRNAQELPPNFRRSPHVMQRFSANFQQSPQNVQRFPNFQIQRFPRSFQQSPQNIQRFPNDMQRFPTNFQLSPQNVQRFPHDMQRFPTNFQQSPQNAPRFNMQRVPMDLQGCSSNMNRPQRFKNAQANPVGRGSMQSLNNDLLNDEWFASRPAQAQDECLSNVSHVIMGGSNLQDEDRVRSQSGTRGNPQKKPDVENTKRPPRITYPIGFKRLQEISNMEPVNIVLELSNSNPFFLRLEEETTEPDLIVLIVKIMSVITDSTFAETKAQLLLRICNTRFLKMLSVYMTELPNTRINDKMRNRLFWNNIDSFWLNFNRFCYCMITVSPTVACEKLATLIDLAKFCIAGLERKQSEIVREDIVLDLEELEVKLLMCMEERDKEELKPEKCRQHDMREAPFGDFRMLSIIPSVEDIMEKPNIRPIISKGAYQSVEHYLDIQFRLLREDFISPIREGIVDYLGKKVERGQRGYKKNGSIRLYQNVQFLHSSFARNRIGILVDFEAGYRNERGESIKSKYAKFKWERCKRFMFGSLLLFTSNDFRNIIFARVVGRDIALLKKGHLIVAPENDVSQPPIDFKAMYLMVESEVYFEPYYHVLNALKKPDLVENFPFPKYIINVQTDVLPPEYIKNEELYTFRLANGAMSSKRVADIARWPTGDELGLNVSQMQAFQTALLREFAVIQGPPGTGKTFIGLRIAEVLLNNFDFDSSPMLVVCYTNHALDQFLEGILKFTDSIVRIGGQSKNEKMDVYNLKNLRSRIGNSTYAKNNKVIYETRQKTEQCMGRIKRLEEDIEMIQSKEHVINASTIFHFIPELKKQFAQCYKSSSKDVILEWLLENKNVSQPNREPHRPRKKQLDNEAVKFDLLALEEALEDIVYDDLNLENLMDINVLSTVALSFSVKNENDVVEHMYQTLNELAEETPSAKIDAGMQSINRNLIKKIEKLEYVMACLSTYASSSSAVNSNLQLRELTNEQRWTLYFQWLNKIAEILSCQTYQLQDNYKKLSMQYEELLMMNDRELLKDFKLIGITTTGAARLQPLLRSLKSPIVIAEEAAEVLESHIVVSLTEFCRHLILIGDHKQLRPSTAVYRLAKHLNLELSLFERMVTNGVHCSTLKVQHRMRPEISCLISPSIYEDLEDHASVTDFPNVRGMTKNIYFINHNSPEDQVDESASRKNHHEAAFLIKLARYIIQQGYEPSDLTILATYTGQMFYLMELRGDYPILKNVRITVVDNFQGEESKIILLSLVRSNKEANIGFLKTENRVCVALSRAKEGFYMIGNMANLTTSSELWVKINKTLEQQHAVGKYITLQCEIHRDVFTKVCEPSDFDPIAEGGCTRMCNSSLDCGHKCGSICHSVDRSHREYRCKENCTRTCKREHPCLLMCWMDCGPCKVNITKHLPCGHNQKTPCHIKSKDVKCLTKVEVVLEECGHKVIKECHRPINTVGCTYPCEDRLPCGHTCVWNCHKKKDPDHLTYKCYKDCQRNMQGCSLEHKCREKCSEECPPCTVKVMKNRDGCTHKEEVLCNVNINDEPCKKLCKRAIPKCGHHCKKKCSETCGGCTIEIDKVLPCGHTGKILCGRDGDERYPLPNCRELMQHGFPSPCGHKFLIPCYRANFVFAIDQTIAERPSDEELLSYCKEKCNVEMVCGHNCAGDCSTCYQKRVHILCAAKCGRMLVCGHICDVPCNESCPPCNKKCEVRCSHNKCANKCGEVCTPCVEKCQWKCPHLKCNELCGKLCSRKNCEEKCPLELNCGHPCRGVCGEPCPTACKVCDPENFPCDLLGDHYEDDIILVQLQDCGHMMDIDELDAFMNTEDEKGEVFLKCCPFCKTPILNTRRCLDVVKKNMKDNIQQAKERIFGDKKKINENREYLFSKITEIVEQFPVLTRDCPNFRNIALRIDKLLKPVVKNRRQRLSLMDLEAFKFTIEVLDILGNDTQDLHVLNTDKALIVNQMMAVVGHLIRFLGKLSSQLHTDIQLEMQRLASIIQYVKLLQSEQYKEGKTQLDILQANNAVKAVLFAYARFDYDGTEAAMNTFQKSLKTVVTKAERNMVFKAVNFSKGHWYRCPNGHLYVIADCGQAMVISRCPECGAQVGGTHHALLRDNTPAADAGI